MKNSFDPVNKVQKPGKITCNELRLIMREKERIKKKLTEKITVKSSK